MTPRGLTLAGGGIASLDRLLGDPTTVGMTFAPALGGALPVTFRSILPSIYKLTATKTVYPRQPTPAPPTRLGYRAGASHAQGNR